MAIKTAMISIFIFCRPYRSAGNVPSLLAWSLRKILTLVLRGPHSQKSHLLNPPFSGPLVTQNMMQEGKEVFSEIKNIRLVTVLNLIKCLNRSTNKDCSLRAHLFMTYPLISQDHSLETPVNSCFWLKYLCKKILPKTLHIVNLKGTALNYLGMYIVATEGENNLCKMVCLVCFNPHCIGGGGQICPGSFIIQNKNTFDRSYHFLTPF